MTGRVLRAAASFGIGGNDRLLEKPGEAVWRGDADSIYTEIGSSRHIRPIERISRTKESLGVF